MNNVPLGADPLLPGIYRKSRDPYLCNCEATVSRGRKVFKSIAIIVTPAVPCGNSLSRNLTLAGPRSSWMTGRFGLFL
jgi:hypothetical protein